MTMIKLTEGQRQQVKADMGGAGNLRISGWADCERYAEKYRSVKVVTNQ